MVESKSAEQIITWEISGKSTAWYVGEPERHDDWEIFIQHIYFADTQPISTHEWRKTDLGLKPTETKKAVAIVNTQLYNNARGES